MLRPVPNSTGVRDDQGFDVPADFVRVRDYSRDGIRRSLESSLVRLGLDRVDIAFVHDPDDFYVEVIWRKPGMSDSQTLPRAYWTTVQLA